MKKIIVIACLQGGGIGNQCCHAAAGAATGAATGVTAVGGGGQVRRNGPTEQQVGIFGIVNEHIAGAGDGLDCVIVTHFPGVHRIFLDPAQQHIQAFDDTVGAPHIAGVAPADIHVKQRTGAVATDGHTGIVVRAAFTVGCVATGAVLTGIGRTQVHDIANIGGAGSTQAFTLGPDMLLVVGNTGIPGTAHLQTAVQGGHISRITQHTVGVLIDVLTVAGGGGAVLGEEGVVADHQRLQGRIQAAGRSIGGGSATGDLAQGGILVRTGIEALGIGSKEATVLTSGAPVGQVAVYGFVVDCSCAGIAGGSGDDPCGRRRRNDTGEHGKHQTNHQNQ